MKLLYVKSSPRVGRSHSLAAADAFADAYGQAHPGDQVETVDVFADELPVFDGPALDAKYAILHGKEFTDAQKTAWARVEEVIETFKSADKYLFAVPMWNFGIPYRLKQYLDILIQPTYTFSFSPETGYTGLVTDKPVAVVYARGGEYSEGEAAAFDHQKSYFELVLGFIGFTDIRAIVVEPTLMGGPEVAAQKREKAVTLAKEIAQTY